MLRVPTADANAESFSQRPIGPDHGFLLDDSARRWVKDQWITNTEKTKQIACMACFCCVRVIRLQASSTGGLPDIQASERALLPHAKACLELSNVLQSDQNLLSDIEWQVFGDLFLRLGLEEQAIGCFKLALQDSTTMNSIERTETLLSLSLIYHQRGTWKECKDLLGEIDVDKVHRQDAGLGRRAQLAKAFEAKAEGNLDHANERFGSLESYQEVDCGPVDIRTIFTVQRRAAALKQLGKLDHAQALYRRAFLSYHRVLGINNSVTLEAAEELAQVYELSGMFEKAEELFNLTIKVKRKSLGEGHPSTAISVAKYAALCDIKGDFELADEKYDEAFEIISSTLGTMHPMFLAIKENQALSYRKRAEQILGNAFTEEAISRIDENFRKAESIYNEIIKAKEKSREVVREKMTEEAVTKAVDLYSEDQVLTTKKKLLKLQELESRLRRQFNESTPDQRESDERKWKSEGHQEEK